MYKSNSADVESLCVRAFFMLVNVSSVSAKISNSCVLAATAAMTAAVWWCAQYIERKTQRHHRTKRHCCIEMDV